MFVTRRLLTPTAKSFTLSEDSASPIVMDEYGQTPDHFYLPTNPPKRPATLSQVKRRLNLESVSPKTPKSTQKTPSKRAASTSPYCNSKKNAIDKQRYDTSLGQLTKKFLELITNSPDGIINLNRACTILSVPKRRIYDITNVLEGAGLVEKKSRNNIQWKNGLGDYDNDLKYELESNIDILESKENQLDELIHNTRAAISHIKNEDKKYAFVTNKDIQILPQFQGQTLIGIKASPDTLLEAHENFKIRLKSQENAIAAYLFTDEPTFKAIENGKNEEAKIKIENSKILPSGLLWDEFRKITEMNPLNVTPPRRQRGDNPVLKYALITEEDDLAPIGKHFLLQTEDQNCDYLPFVHLEPPVLEEDYSFTLDVGEGISDLFDTCDFSCS